MTFEIWKNEPSEEEKKVIKGKVKKLIKRKKSLDAIDTLTKKKPFESEFYTGRGIEEKLDTKSEIEEIKIRLEPQADENSRKLEAKKEELGEAEERLVDINRKYRTVARLAELGQMSIEQVETLSEEERELLASSHAGELVKAAKEKTELYADLQKQLEKVKNLRHERNRLETLEAGGLN
jgi:hypothetical protein